MALVKSKAPWETSSKFGELNGLVTCKAWMNPVFRRAGSASCQSLVSNRADEFPGIGRHREIHWMDLRIFNSEKFLVEPLRGFVFTSSSGSEMTATFSRRHRP